jgi:hypothetical protein
MLMLPFVATLTALYESMPASPRPFWLDEAFDGLDTTNRATVLGLLGEFDLDVLVVGPVRLLNSPTCPSPRSTRSSGPRTRIRAPTSRSSCGSAVS